MIFLKQSTATDVIIGCFIDDTDGKTPETALTIAQADVRLSKNAAAYSQKTDTTSPTHREHGYYMVDLDATDTGTLGTLDIHAHVTGALPVYQTFMVVTANMWDSLCGSDILQSDVREILGSTQSAADLQDLADTGYDPATHKIQGVVLNDTTTTNTDMRGTDSANTVVPDAAGVAATPAEVATALTDIHLDHLFATDYNPAVKPGVATALLNELVEDDTGISRYTANALEQAPTGGSAPTVGEIADGVWDELKMWHNVSGSFGSYLDDEITSRNAVTPPTVVEIRTEMDTNSVKMAPSQTLDDYKATGFATPSEYDTEFSDIKGTGFTKDVHSLPQCLTGAGGSAPTVNEIADGVWDELQTFHTTPGSFGHHVDNSISSRNAVTPPTVAAIREEIDNNSVDLNSILEDTNELQTNQGGWVTATGFATSAELATHDTKLDAVGTNVDTLVDEASGKWEIVNDQMIFYKADNLTEIYRFNLFNAAGVPAMEDVVKRERV